MLTAAHIDTRLALLALAFKDRTGRNGHADATRKNGEWSVYVRENSPVTTVGDLCFDADFDRACDKVAAKIAKRASLVPTAATIAKAHGLTTKDLARLVADDLERDVRAALGAA
jgi:hypothetical protein